MRARIGPLSLVDARPTLCLWKSFLSTKLRWPKGRVSCSLLEVGRHLRRLAELPEQGWREKLRASQPEKKERQMLVLGHTLVEDLPQEQPCALRVEGFATKKGGSRWTLYEPSQELQRKKEKG